MLAWVQADAKRPVTATSNDSSVELLMRLLRFMLGLSVAGIPAVLMAPSSKGKGKKA